MAGPAYQGYTADQAGAAAQARASTSTAQGYTARTGTAQNATAVLRDVRPEDTVQYQIDSVINTNSPLMQRARAQSAADQVRRGTVNSSMAIQAGQAAVLDAALPIAQQDAKTYETQGRDNQTWANDIGKFNVGENNDMTALNVTEQNTASRTNAVEANTTARANASLLTETSIRNADATNRRAEFNVTQSNAARQFGAEAFNRSSIVGFEQAAATQRQAMADSTRVQIANADRESQQIISQMEMQNRAAIAGTQAGAQIFNQYQAGIVAIQNDPNLTPEERARAQNNLTAASQRGLQMSGAASGQNLGDYLDGVTYEAPAPGPGSPGTPGGQREPGNYPTNPRDWGDGSVGVDGSVGY